MILSGLKIKEEVLNDNISIVPYSDNLLNPNSYNYRLADTIYEITDNIIDPAKKTNIKK